MRHHMGPLLLTDVMIIVGSNVLRKPGALEKDSPGEYGEAYQRAKELNIHPSSFAGKNANTASACCSVRADEQHS